VAASFAYFAVTTYGKEFLPCLVYGYDISTFLSFGMFWGKLLLPVAWFISIPWTLRDEAAQRRLPRSLRSLDVEAVEKPLFKPQKPLPYGAIHIAPFVISSIEFRSRRSASADSCLRGSSA
jgi:hypothetical protein